MSLRWLTLRCALLSIVLVAFVPSAGAQAADRGVDQARTHFQAGQALYTLQRYADALREFRAGYDLSPRARFLLNVAHCHRRMGQLAEARDAFRHFLERVPESDPDRAEARTYLAEVEAALARAPSLIAATSPPSAEQVAAALATVPAPIAAAPRRRALRHVAWALPLGVAVVVGVSLGIYFGTRPDACAGATLSCFDAGR